MSLKYRTSAGTSASNFSDLVVKVGDTLPIGTEVDYDGQTAPAGWQEVTETNLGDVVVDSIRSKNMFNKNILWNAWINLQGQLVESASNRASDYIDVHGMDYITISGSNTTTVIEAFYDSSKNFVSYVEVSAETATLQVPNNAYYLRVTVKPAVLNTYQIEEGSVATEYRPYQELDNIEVYSTRETRIGTWIDGKPLYRKVIDYFPTGTIGQLSAITDILVPHNVSNIKQVVDCKMVSDSSSGLGIFPHIGTSNGQFLNRGTSIVSFDTTILRLRIINDTWTSSHFYITIEYTKTTD